MVGTVNISHGDSYYRAVQAIEEHFNMEVCDLVFPVNCDTLANVPDCGAISVVVKFIDEIALTETLIATETWLY